MNKVLLIDDDATMLSMLKYKLEKAGYEIETASDGEKGKEMITSFKPDVVVTDLMMPYVSGLELVEYVRTVLKLELPLIVLSSAGQEKTVVQAFEIGATDFVTKPFSPNELLIRIKRNFIALKSGN